MRFLPWIYALLAACALVWLGSQLLESAHESPRSLLESAKRRASGPDADPQRALADLEYALDLAQADHDDAVIEEALIERARLLRISGGLTQARADLERVLTHYRPNSPAIEAALAGIVLASGDVEGALQRCEAVLARDPSQSDAWATRARALLQLATQRLDRAAATAGTTTASGSTDETQRLMRHIATLERNDPDRARLVEQLVKLFAGADQARLSEVLGDLDSASEFLKRLPESIAQSMRGNIQRDTLHEYLRLLRDSGRNDAAIDFGYAVRNFPPLRRYPRFLAELMQSLIDAGRPEQACDVPDPNVGTDVLPDAAFYRTWCDALYQAKRWRNLAPIANVLRANSTGEERAPANFYLGLALARQQRYSEAASVLSRAVDAPGADFFPGAQAISMQALAECERGLGMTSDERAVLTARLKRAPDMYEGVGGAWLRLSELQLAENPPRWVDGFESLTRALQLAPERRAEIEPKWRALGKGMLTGSKLDVDAEFARLEALGLPIGESTNQPYLMLRIAEEHLAHENWGAAALVAGRLLGSYPHFLPALDLAIRAELAAHDYQRAAEHLRDRIATAGADAETVARMASIPRGELGPEWTLQLVQLDPQGLGRRLAAELLRSQGRAAEALAGIEMVPVDRLGDEGVLVQATLAYDLKRDDSARASLAAISPRPEVLVHALPLALDLGSRAHDAAHITNLLRMLELKVDPDLDALMTSADRMVLAGMPASAAELCTRLDVRPRWRSGALFLHAAQAAMLLGDGETADESLDRAAAYDDSGAPELGLLVRAVERRSWSELPRRVTELLATNFKPTPLQDAALAALGERLADAQAIVRSGREREPREALWGLLEQALAVLGGSEAQPADAPVVFGVNAQGVAQRDPRPLLVRLATAFEPRWSAWCIADLSRAQTATPNTLWPGYVAARACANRGLNDDAEARGRALIGASRTFVPAWDLVGEAIAQDVRRADHPRLLKFAQQRRDTLGTSTDDRVEDLIAQAHILEKQQRYDEAIVAVNAALDIDPKKGAALRELAQLRRKLAQWPQAIAIFHRALENAPVVSDNHPVAEFLALLDEAEAASPALRQGPSIADELDFLAKRFPSDPLVALARARREFPAEARGDRARIALIATRLDTFRKRNDDASIESLRTGAARAWFAFLSTVDPERAYEFARDELAREPASIDLWRLLGEAAAATHRVDEAVNALQTALAMLPDGATARRLAELCVERGDDLEVVRGYVNEAARLDKVRADDPRMQWTLAYALVHGSDAELGEGLTILQRLWASRDAANHPEEMARVGETYGIALCRRNLATDRETARAVLEETAPHLTDPTRRTLLVALAGISRYLGIE